MDISHERPCHVSVIAITSGGIPLIYFRHSTEVRAEDEMDEVLTGQEADEVLTGTER